MSNSRSKKILRQLVAPNTSVTPEASSNIKVNVPDNNELLSELENYNFNLDIESIDQFDIILDDNVIKFNSNNSFVNNYSDNFNNYYDTDEPVTLESNVENYHTNTTIISSNDEYYVLTPDNEESLEVDVVMPVSLTNNNNTDCNLDNDDNVNNCITNPITNRNVLFADNEPSPEVEVFGKKKRKKDDRVVNKLNREKGKSYKKIKQDNTIELVAQKEMKPNPCLDKTCLNKCSTITEKKRIVIFVRYWNELDHNRKRDYLLSCMHMQDVKRNYVSHANNRSCTYSYSVAIDNVQIKVCRKCILNTLNISEKLLRYTRDNKSDLFSTKPDNRGRQKIKHHLSKWSMLINLLKSFQLSHHITAEVQAIKNT